MNILAIIARGAARTEFARKALEEKADLSPFREKPSARILFGIFLMAFSYVIGWPAVALFGALSIYFKEPLIVILGGPAIYGTSHLVFLAGMYLAGARYTYIFLRWATRKFLEKYLDAAREKDGFPSSAE
ncbi:MAG TPA: hypothetical protein PLM53_09030 [Spirochaetota bacterium]|nr:hypothetical protein [Spirochaetota bacterium]HPC40130.1 hypothetical protein [Spirochaetota bacterium]HPL15822.1 hypothetical protein [Spirochaetota bacterium]HQF08534.1 hypothetical protein [Spirochaetota bacterium]HQH97229.1 hypothetical protein [Spirochaetota bacterium]